MQNIWGIVSSFATDSNRKICKLNITGRAVIEANKTCLLLSLDYVPCPLCKSPRYYRNNNILEQEN